MLLCPSSSLESLERGSSERRLWPSIARPMRDIPAADLLGPAEPATGATDSEAARRSPPFGEALMLKSESRSRDRSSGESGGPASFAALASCCSSASFWPCSKAECHPPPTSLNPCPKLDVRIALEGVFNSRTPRRAGVELSYGRREGPACEGDHGSREAASADEGRLPLPASRSAKLVEMRSSGMFREGGCRGVGASR
jgi:hypothetical protein